MSGWISIVATVVAGVVAIYFIRELLSPYPVQYQNDLKATKGIRLYQIGAAIICIILAIINLWIYLRGA